MSDSKTDSKNIMELMGGREGVDLFLGQLYLEIINDSELSVFFRNCSMQQIIGHQQELMCEALGASSGASSQYTGRDLAKAHQYLVKDMGLADRHVDILKEKATIALTNCGFNQEIIDSIHHYFESNRDAVLNRKSPPQ